MTEITSKLSTALAGRYQIERHLGEGGMATVYLAEDLKHKRKVAVKVLRPELAAVLGAERFVQEITTTANLQHPHILPLFDSGEADSFLYYVMPFIDGETLRDKLNRETQLGIEEAVDITTAIADALDYAHRQNVIHRDIKPENILLHEGRPMVADFGIALAVSAAAGGRMTETGLSLGTPHYMSPEQATAEKDLTNRSDIYSLGSVLYEMLTGSPPHVGSSAQQIIMKIVTDEARAVTELRKSVPPHVAAATAKSLEKLAADRFETAAKFAEALSNAAFTLPTAQAEAAVTAAPASNLWKRVSVGVTAVAALLAVVALWGWLRPQPKTVFRLGVGFAEGEQILRVSTRRFAISPDGTRIVYVGAGVGTGVRQLWVRELDALHAQPLPGTDLPRAVFFSPDGQSVGFVDGEPGDLKIISIEGGSVRTVAADSVNPWGGMWGPDGWLYFTVASGRLARVRASGGPVEILAAPDSSETAGGGEYDWPEALPNGRGLVFQFWQSSLGNSDIATLSLETGEVRVLTHAVSAKYLPNGYLLYVTIDGSLFVQRFDQDGLEFTGEPIAIETGIRIETFAGTGQFDVSRNGHFVYQPGGSGAQDHIVRVDRSGSATVIDPDWRGGFETVALSPDGSLLAVGVGSEGGQIWVKELDRGPARLLTFEGNGNSRPSWMPDGSAVTFVQPGNGLWSARSDGGAPPQQVYTGPQVWEATWSSDATWLVVRIGGTGTGTRDIHAIRPGIDSSARVIVASPADEYAPALSPNNRWLAYVSNETGREEVYVRPFPDAEREKHRVTVSGGTEPHWSRSGRELFVRNARGEMAVHAVRFDDETFAVEPAEVLFDATEYLSDNYHTAYDVAPDDQQFYMIEQSEIMGGDLILVINWFEELKAKVGN